MKVTKNDLLSIGKGKTKVFSVTPREMMAARSYIYNLTLMTGMQWKTKFDKHKLELSVTKLK